MWIQIEIINTIMELLKSHKETELEVGATAG
jgi:hypothetical protein